MAALPKLLEGGRVVFESAEDLKSAYDAYLHRGALAVIPETPLEPLARVEVTMSGGYIDEPIAMVCEVVVIQPDKSLLRVVEPSPETLAHLAEPPPSGPEELPGPAWAELRAGDVLFFQTATHWQAGRRSIETQGGVIASVPDDVEPEEEMMLTLQVGAYEHPGGVLVTLAPQGERDAAVYFEDSPLRDALLEDVSISANSPPPSSGAPAPISVLDGAPVPEPVSEPESPPVVVTPPPPEPAPEEPPPTVEPVAEEPAEDEPEASEAQPGQPASDAVPPARPPMLRDDVVTFASRSDFDAAGADINLVQAVMAMTDDVLTSARQLDVLLEVEGYSAETRIPATLSPGAGGAVIVQFDDSNKLAAAMVEVASRPPSQDDPGDGDSDDADAPKTRLKLQLRESGTLHNPTSDVMELLGLALSRDLTPKDLERPNAHLFLRWLLTRQGTVRVEAAVDGKPAPSFVIMDGKEVRSSASAATLAESLSAPTLEYETEVLRRPPAMSQRFPILALMQELVSALTHHFETVELERALAVHGNSAPQLNDVGKQLLPAMQFSSSHLRIAERRLTGKERREALYDAAVGERTVMEVLFALDISGGIDWVDAAGLEQAERKKREKERLDRMVRTAADLWEKIKDANHFETMGLHWSTPPRKIEPTYEELKAMYGPGGEARKADAQASDQIWRRVEKAYAILKDPKARKAHRKDAYALKWDAQIDLMLDRADIAIYRKDFEEAKDLLMVCQDVQATQKAAELLKKLKDRQDKIESAKKQMADFKAK